MDLQILAAQITGIEAKLTRLREQAAMFQRAAGLDEAAEKALADREEAVGRIAGVKKQLADLQTQKAESLKATTEALAAKMSEVLPVGKGLFEITDEGLFIGWEKPDGTRVPWLGLSGGERNPFDQALSYALLGPGEKVLLIEAAESDREHLEALLDHLAANTADDCQVIVGTWVMPREPNGWAVMEIDQCK